VRLAFAVAAHLDPEILIVDEVLAVGDAEFQKKCLGKMKDVSTNEGRTVLFVSHNLSSVKMLCSCGILLSSGQLLCKDATNKAIQRYIATSTNDSGRWIRTTAREESEIRFESVTLLDSSGNIKSEFEFNETIHLKISAFVSKRFDNAQFAIRVTNQEGIPVFTTCNTDEAMRYVSLKAGNINYTIQITPGILAAGRYLMKIAAHIPNIRIYD